MAEWKATIRLKHLISHDDAQWDESRNAIVKALQFKREQWSNLLEKSKPRIFPLGFLGNTVEDIEDSLSQFGEIIVSLECAGDMEQVNYDLDELYDWCDDHRIWID